MPVEVVDETTPEPEASGLPAGLVSFAERAASEILSCLERSAEEVCVLLVNDDRMQQLNRDWRGKDSTTDVLSFSQQEGDALVGNAGMLGDLVVSVNRLQAQAADGGWTIEEELVRLLLHGTLHLLGYDHEDGQDAVVMRAEEKRLVEHLRVRGIDCAWEEEP